MQHRRTAPAASFPHAAVWSRSAVALFVCLMAGADVAFAQKTAVRTVAVTEEPTGRTTTQPATVHPYFTAEIEARLAGYVAEVKADIGDVVSAGDVLATISVPEMQKQMEILQAEVQKAKANEAQAVAGVRLAEADIQASEARQSQAESMMASVEASVAAAEAEFNRTSNLVDRQSVQAKVLDEVRERRDAARAMRQSTGSSIEAAKADVTVAEAKLEAARADVEAAKAATAVTQAQSEELAERLNYAELLAPFDGVVTHRRVDPGDLVRDGGGSNPSPLIVVSRVDIVRVRVPIPEADAAYVQKGDAIELTFPSFPGDGPLNATVTRSSGSLDPSTRTMLVEAELPNEDGKLIPGMFGQAKVTVAGDAVTQSLPARAVRFDEGGKAYVYVVGEDETVTIVPVTTGRDSGTSIEITSGLVAGQHVIDANLNRFTDGQPVRVVE